MRLEWVGHHHAAGYLAMLADFEAAGEPYIFNDADLARRDFIAFVADLDDEAAGRGLPPGIIAQTTYVLIDDGGTVVGEFRFRPDATEPYEDHHGHSGYNIAPSHRRQGYATYGLRLLLNEAARHGLAGIALTIELANAASRRVARTNGGTVVTTSREVHKHPQEIWWVPVEAKDGRQ